MLRRGKRIIAAKQKVEPTKRYTLKEATEMIVSMAGVKFDETVDAAVRLGVNPAHADQMVRGSVVLPNGLGKTVRVLVFAKGDKRKKKPWMPGRIWSAMMKSLKRSKAAGWNLTV